MDFQSWSWVLGSTETPRFVLPASCRSLASVCLCSLEALSLLLTTADALAEGTVCGHISGGVREEGVK